MACPLTKHRLHASCAPVTRLPMPRATYLRSYPLDHSTKSLLACLVNFNFYEKKATLFRCNVTIIGMSPGAPWWDVRYALCSRRAVPATFSSTQPDVYKCSNIACSSTTAVFMFRLCLIGRDKSGEAEFTLYGKNAEQVVGLPALCVLESNHPSVSAIRNNHVAATLIRHVPEELGRLVSIRCKFVVRISIDGFNGRWPSFHVKTVEALSTVR